MSHFSPEADAAGRNISWGAIIAGIVTFFAMLITFSLIGSAIGLGVTDVTSNDPFDGVGVGLIIWAILSLLISLFLAGFVAGVSASRAGLIHGFLTWATGIVLLFALLTFTTINTFQAVGSVVGTVGGAAGSGVATVAGTAGDAIGSGFDSVVDNIGEVDTGELEQNVEEILADTDIPELQPEYLQNELSEVQDEILAAAQEIAVNPDNFDQQIEQLGDSLATRAEEINNAVDEEAIANAVSENTDLSEQEAEEATQNIVDGLNEATTATSEQIETAQVNIEQTAAELEVAIQDLRESTEEATDTAAQVSIWAFVAMILTLVFTSFAGIIGATTARNNAVARR
ncbi:hypothetical protein FLK61_24400 [Paenalkalicoccus suaedae]|uniref:Uncharacterized protein n=2 Tax=Paenalkalicoccus suaedae TaxID=2592382 RepID=A0A859FK47_9BACI|nr:hypothetical protein FLK61_24400 [Paenalkalicoccus suaedae]